MKIKCSDSFSISYSSGKTIDDLLGYLKKEFLLHAGNKNIIEIFITTEAEAYSDYERPVMRFTYEREETDAEIKAREANEKSRLNYERKQYEALKKKFG